MPAVFEAVSLSAIALVIVPAAQIDAVALRAALRHAHDIDEEFAALLEFRRQQFEMREMGNIEDGFAVHKPFTSHSK